MPLPPYIVVTPVRDEEKFVGQMVESMFEQAHLPIRWVIVDDGSTDQTKAILSAKIAGVDWVTLLDTGSERRNLGVGEVLAFTRGLAAVGGEGFEFLVKLDADVSLEPDYFAKILGRMSGDPRWGIASGVYWEEEGGMVARADARVPRGRGVQSGAPAVL